MMTFPRSRSSPRRVVLTFCGISDWLSVRALSLGGQEEVAAVVVVHKAME